MHKASVVPEGRYTLPSSGALSGMCAGLMRFSTTPFGEGRPFYPACPVIQEAQKGRRPISLANRPCYCFTTDFWLLWLIFSLRPRFSATRQMNFSWNRFACA